MLYERGYTTGYERGKEIMFKDIIKYIEYNKNTNEFRDLYGNIDIDTLIMGLINKFNK
jgi:hypothetical protein